MKNLIMASVIALASTFVVAAPSSAASVTITTTERDHYRPHYKPVEHRRHHRVACFTKKTKSYHHGRMVVTTKRVCS